MVSGDELEIFRHQLQGIVEEMGVTLERTAFSTNIKIRQNYSCALFDADANHIAQHTAAPIQMAALKHAVPGLVEERIDDMSPGDGYLINDPSKGGAVHLPDLILISPMFSDEDELIGFVGNNAHHVDIGGETPGGIPIDSTSLYGEGLILPGVRLVRDWELDEEMLRLLTRNVRGARMRVGDYQAQLGANQIGSRRFNDLYERYDSDTLSDYIDELCSYTETRVRSELRQIPDGTYQAMDYLDGDGIKNEPLRIALTVQIDADEVVFDFTGTADQNRGPTNADPSSVFGAVIIAIRSLFEDDIPLNDGFYRPFELITPAGSMVNPGHNAPIAGTGEIVQRVADLVLKSLAEAIPDQVIAATKGTSINVAYGGIDPRDGEEYVYFETFAGGYGGRPTKDGMDAVQPHLQNTANSPVEEIEREVPMYIRRYELREDSEGAGRYRGGLGIRRDMEFYDDEACFTILSDRARFAPWGLFGGHSGALARYRIDPDTADEYTVNSKSTTQLEQGQVASIMTPGGGGYGDPLDRDPTLVRQDVLNEKVSLEKARDVYGVVLDADTLSIDHQATARRRQEIATILPEDPRSDEKPRLADGGER